MMAKIVKNTALQGVNGSIGNLVYRQMPDGSTRVSRKPDFRNRKFSQDQKNHQSRFKQAVAYACLAAKSQPIYAELARGTSKTPYNLALSDWFNPPVIERIERKGNSIRVTASDNIRVTEVRIRIVDMEGNVLEEGQASQVDPAEDPERWEYLSDTPGRLEITACDLAGNQTRAEL